MDGEDTDWYYIGNTVAEVATQTTLLPTVAEHLVPAATQTVQDVAAATVVATGTNGGLVVALAGAVGATVGAALVWRWRGAKGDSDPVAPPQLLAASRAEGRAPAELPSITGRPFELVGLSATELAPFPGSPASQGATDVPPARPALPALDEPSPLATPVASSCPRRPMPQGEPTMECQANSAEDIDKLHPAYAVACLGMAALVSAGALGRHLLTRAGTRSILPPQLTSVARSSCKAHHPVARAFIPGEPIVSNEIGVVEKALPWPAEAQRRVSEGEVGVAFQGAVPGCLPPLGSRRVVPDMSSVDVGFDIMRMAGAGLGKHSMHKAEVFVVDGIVRRPRPATSRIFRLLPRD
mmetsp:Transcript_48611/g.104163  ORF Transcript_48611/g.104163 Transcript_48611/m.104163 type:complete len:353 (-) Transcript_48611:19-1077(-)